MFTIKFLELIIIVWLFFYVLNKYIKHIEAEKEAKKRKKYVFDFHRTNK